MFFDGSGRDKKGVSMAGNKKARATPQEVAVKSAQDKMRRELEARRHKSAMVIQKYYRRHRTVANSRNVQRLLFDELLSRKTDLGCEKPKDPLHFLGLLKSLSYFFSPWVDRGDLKRLSDFVMEFRSPLIAAASAGVLWTDKQALLMPLVSMLIASSCYGLGTSSAEMLTLLEELLGSSGERGNSQVLLAQLSFVNCMNARVLGLFKRLSCRDPLAAANSGAVLLLYVTFAKRVIDMCRSIQTKYNVDEVEAGFLRLLTFNVLSSSNLSSEIIKPVVHSIGLGSDLARCCELMHRSLYNPAADTDGSGTRSTGRALYCLNWKSASGIACPSSPEPNLAPPDIGKQGASFKRTSHGELIQQSAKIFVEERSRVKSSVEGKDPSGNQKQQWMAILAIGFVSNLYQSMDSSLLADNDHLLLFKMHKIVNELLLNSSKYDFPLHAAMYYLNHIHESNAISGFTYCSLKAVEMRGQVTLVVPETVAVNSGPAEVEIGMDIDQDQTPVWEAKPKRVATAGSACGLHIEPAISRLFQISVKDELDSWNIVYTYESRRALCNTLLFALSSQGLDVLHATRYGESMDNLSRLILSNLSMIIASSGNALPENKFHEKEALSNKVKDVYRSAEENLHRDAISKVMITLSGVRQLKNVHVCRVKKIWRIFEKYPNPWDVGKDAAIDREHAAEALSHLYLICVITSHQLMALQDDEFYEGRKAIDPSKDLVQLLDAIKDGMFFLSWTNPVLLLPYADTALTSDLPLLRDRLSRMALFQSLSRLFNQLSIRNERRGHRLHAHGRELGLASEGSHFGYLTPDKWIWDELRHPGVTGREMYSQLSRRSSGIDASSPLHPSEWELGESESNFKMLDGRIQVVLLNAPQLIRFEVRAAVLHNLIEADRSELRIDERDAFGPMANDVVRINRGRILSDAFNALGHEGGNKIKRNIRVVFVSEDGHEEAGIDGGGLFKEFLESFMKEAFNPDNRYFIATESHELIPSDPIDGGLADSSSRETLNRRMDYYKFIGKMLAKALYNEILLEPQLSPVFLNLLLGRTNMIDDMSYLDTQFYKSLMNIKLMILNGQDVSILGLTFTTTSGVDLVPNGSMIAVTNQTALQYIYLLAKHKLNLSVEASKAFLSGFREIIPVSWLRMFNPREMQSVIGGELKQLDLVDLKRNVAYVGGYHESQPYIQMFWSVIANFSTQEQGDFLKFITSCSRQPLLGFDKLNPKIGIQEVPMRYPEDGPDAAPRLPSAATCFNLLKLPRYPTRQMLEEKLKYAIACNTGFELS